MRAELIPCGFLVLDLSSVQLDSVKFDLSEVINLAVVSPKMN